MKKILSLATLFFSLLLFSQNITISQFKKVDSSNIKSLLNYLGPIVKKQTTNNKDTSDNDNLFRMNFVMGDYKTSLEQLNTVRNSFMKGNPKMAAAMGAQYEVYMNTLQHLNNKQDFNKTYQAELLKKYNSLATSTQVFMPFFFGLTPKETKEDLSSFIKSDIAGKSSIDLKTALLLFRKYGSNLIAEATYTKGLPLLEKLDQESYTVNDSVIVYTKDKKEISISTVINKKIQHPGPVIIVNTIYSSPGNIGTAKQLASNGYSCVYINTRGKYHSKETIEPFEHEYQDISDVIDWIVQQPWSNGKVGMIGGSYLGFSQWAATKKLHPALKTIIPQAPVGIGIDYPMSGNVFMSYMLRWIDYVTVNKLTDSAGFTNEKKWNDLYKKWYTSGLAFNKLDSINGKKDEIFQRWLKHPSYDAYWQSMTPDPKEYSKINIPILTTTGYFDDDQLGAMYYYKNHIKYNPNADHYVVIGPYDHYGPQGYITSEVMGVKIDPIAEFELNEICYQWFDYTLKGKNKPDFLKGKINYEVMGDNIWKSANSMQEFDQTKIKYYLGEDLKLGEHKANKSAFTTLNVNLKDRSDVDKFILTDEPQLISTAIQEKDNSTIFISEAFDKDTELTGSFSASLNFSINKKDCDIVAELYQVLPDGKYFLLSSYLTRASYAKDRSKRQLLTPGKKETIPVTDTPFVSKKIEKGSKLLLKIGIKKSPAWQINYGTGKDVSTETIKDAEVPMEIRWYNESFVEIPLKK
ncbi:CocE/NonD family hydrolase [Elizabethkingia miricola]|uniref:CocE/NonD family hydrolase n=1 Tax=Elizabethkingia bruuniana TaxID=1756149 RepID=UPI00099A02AD|nr:CocE/NonD family hydrolase [Elizabethkingia bruuniana]OPC54137.1 hydrolase [Elizabethkingia bruuniana]OPC64812.1 hydrolase [Elizabethkingia bruuniana]RBI92310.1 CocE/NonD family hydrolase [Elizabethkingia miricola]